MKFTLSWLKQHLDTGATLDELAEKLTLIGLEVEEIADPARELAAFTVAHVTEARQHPDADRLKVCTVETADGMVEVVCGAPNAHSGMKAVFAPSGTTIPATGMVLKPTKIRGVTSNGMLCSEREMGLSDDHEGIIELPEDAEIGMPFAQALGLDDPMIEIAITPNRPDCLGVRGVARDLAAAGLGTLKPEAVKPVEGKYDNPLPIALEFDNGKADACPAFAGRMVRNVKNGPSPAWLQQRLRAIGLRPVNALADITNLIAYDQARPLHVYDADKVKGTIRARMGREGESFLALDGKTYEVDGDMCVIADDTSVLGLGGVMGGEASGTSDDTVNVFIESALFDPLRTARTGRRTGIMSDARYRFERGVDPASVLPGIEQATALIADICGGEPGKTELAGKVPEPDTRFVFDVALVKRLCGLNVDRDRAAEILQALGFACDRIQDGLLQVTAPSWRPDIHEPADLVEEITRIIGIDQVPSVPMTRMQGVARPILTQRQSRISRARRMLALRGLTEAVTWSFISNPIARRFGGGDDALEIANPISSEMSAMRPGLLPGLLMAAQRNLDRGMADIALFEVGQAYRGRGIDDQFVAAAGIRAGRARQSGIGRHWQAGNEADLFEAKADALDALGELGVAAERAQVTSDAPAWFHPGRSGVIRMGPQNELAHFGELHPAVLNALGIAVAIYGFELFLDNIPEPKQKQTKSKPPLQALDLQPVRRDFAFVMKDDVKAGDLMRAAAGADKALIADVRLFDLFEGGGLGEGRKSLAIEVTLQPTDKTLTDAEIDAVAKKIIAQVEKATGAELRG